MSKFASNKNAYGICDITGFRYKLKEMKMTWDGKLVGPDQYDAKHPQLDRRPIALDAQAIKNARPDTSDDNKFFSVYTNVGKGKLGSPAVSLNVAAQIGNLFINETEPTISSSSSHTLASLAVTSFLGDSTVNSNVLTYLVSVAPYGGGNKYYINGVVTPTLNLSEGNTYRFDQSNSSNSGHPLRFSTTANGTHGGGSEYTTGVTTNGTPGSAGAYTQITVAVGAPTLYYYCTNHSGMGAQANTP